MSLKKRVFSFPLPPQSKRDLDSFIERLLSRIPAQVSHITIEGGRIRIEVMAPPSRMKEIVMSIKQVLSEFTDIEIGERYVMQVAKILAGGGPVVSGELLCFVIEKNELCECKVSEKGSIIETRCPQDIVKAYTVKLKKALDELSKLPHLSRGTRRALASLMVLRGFTAYEALDFLEENNLVSWEGDRYTLVKPWKETVYIALKSGSGKAV